MIYRVLDKQTLLCPASADIPAVAKQLAIALAALPVKPARAKVILANHLVRYAMIPYNPVLSNMDEMATYARHLFSQMYGLDGETWDIRLNQDAPNAPLLASAVEKQLLRALRTLFDEAEVKLQSIQPQLMVAYNNSLGQLQKNGSAWFVLAEQDSLCLGLIQQGSWRSVRTVKAGSDWPERLPEILDREMYLSESDDATGEVFLWSPQHWQTALPNHPRWKIHKLQPAIHAGFVQSYDDRFALAMCG
jgi:hypothetical protein